MVDETLKGSLLGLGITSALLVGSYLLAKRCGRNASKLDVYVILWLFWDLALHLCFEMPFAAIVFGGSTVAQSKSLPAQLLKEYAQADKRWLDYDPSLVALILGRVLMTTPFILTLVYAISQNKYYRHYAQITHCVIELYAGWMTFCPELLIGSPNLVTDNKLFFWVYFVLFNGIYVVVPLALCFQSFLAMKEYFPERKKVAFSKRS